MSGSYTNELKAGSESRSGSLRSQSKMTFRAASVGYSEIFVSCFRVDCRRMSNRDTATFTHMQECTHPSLSTCKSIGKCSEQFLKVGIKLSLRYFNTTQKQRSRKHQKSIHQSRKEKGITNESAITDPVCSKNRAMDWDSVKVTDQESNKTLRPKVWSETKPNLLLRQNPNYFQLLHKQKRKQICHKRCCS